MSDAPSQILTAVRRLVAHPETGDPDGVLLARFSRERDQAAFTELVTRHGPLVFGTCRRMLNDSAAAEDVFQATFLVLAQKAATNKWQGGLGPWLHAVATRLSQKMRSRRRLATGEPSVLSTVPAAIPDPSLTLIWDEVKSALDDELSQLPESLRSVLVLCYLQARTRDEAAAELGISLATIKRRLERAKRLLHARLTRRGVSLAAAGLGLLVSEPPLSAGLAEQTSRAAAAWDQEGVASPGIGELLRETAHTVSRLRWIALAATLVLGAGIGAIAYSLWPAGAPSSEPVAIHQETNQKPGQVVLAPAPEAAVERRFPVDPLPAGALARLGSPRFQDFNINHNGAFSPDGKWFATSGVNTPICIWDADGRLVRTHRNHGSVHDLRWKPDGKLAVLTGLCLMQEFAPDKGPDPKEEARMAEEATLSQLQPRTKGQMSGCFLSTDGQKAVAIWHRRAEVYAFASSQSSASAKPIAEVDLPEGDGVWLSTDGKVLLALEIGTKDRPNRLAAFDLTAPGRTGKPVWQMDCPGGNERRPDSCFSAEGKQVVILFSDETVELWDGPAQKRIREFPKLPAFSYRGVAERGIGLSPDGKRLAMISRGKTGEVGGQIIDVGSGKRVCSLSPEPLPQLKGVNPTGCDEANTRFSADGKRVAQICSGVVQIWNADTGENALPLPGHRGPARSLALLADNRTMVSAGDDWTVRGWNLESGLETWRLAFSHDVTVKLAAASGVVVQESDDSGPYGPLSVIEPGAGKIRPMPGKLAQARRIELMAASPDGRKVVAFDPEISAWSVWSWPTGELLKTIPITPPGDYRLNRCGKGYFTPDGKQYVAAMYYSDPAERQSIRSARDHPFIERWDLTEGKLVERIAQKSVDHPMLIPHHSGFYYLSKDNNVQQVRDALSGRIVAKLQTAAGKSLDFRYSAGASLSPDGRTLAICEGLSGNIGLFEMRTGRLRRRLAVEGRYCLGVRFLPDGRLLSQGVTTLVWGVGLQPGGEQLGELEANHCWGDLADPDPEKAWPAMTKLAGSPDIALKIMGKHLRAVEQIHEATMDRIFKSLDADQFREREAASRELDSLGSPAVGAVTARMAKGTSAEVAGRLREFLAKFDSVDIPPVELRDLRAVEVLEAMATPAARAVLVELSTGEPGARLTREANGAVKRLKSR